MLDLPSLFYLRGMFLVFLILLYHTFAYILNRFTILQICFYEIRRLKESFYCEKTCRNFLSFSLKKKMGTLRAVRHKTGRESSEARKACGRNNVASFATKGIYDYDHRSKTHVGSLNPWLPMFSFSCCPKGEKNFALFRLAEVYGFMSGRKH